MFDLMEIVQERRLLRRVGKPHPLDPQKMPLGPGGHAGGPAPTVSQQKLAQPMARAQLIFLRRLSGAHHVPSRLVRGVGDPHGRQAATAVTPCQLRASRRSVFTRSPAFTVRWARPPRTARRARSVASRGHTRWDPPRNTRVIAGDPSCFISLRTDSGRFESSPRSAPSHGSAATAICLRAHRDRRTAPILHDQLSFAQRLCAGQGSNSKRTHALRIGAGRSIMTKLLT